MVPRRRLTSGSLSGDSAHGALFRSSAEVSAHVVWSVEAVGLAWLLGLAWAELVALETCLSPEWRQSASCVSAKAVELLLAMS